MRLCRHQKIAVEAHELPHLQALLTELWQKPNYKTFLRAIAHCGFASFMFGWHVHEKAVMLVLVPLR
jgi:hypothetical protein